MARLAVSLQAGVCLLALLACAACAAAADSDAGKQSTATAGAQQYGGDEHEHYGESDHAYQHKRTEATLYLQETSQQVIDSATVFARHTFRCSKDSDAADVCLQPPHYGGYDEHKQYDDADDLLSGLPFNNDAAVCQTAFLRGSCPASIPAEAGCEILQINCTIGKQAAECGCPYADGFSFTSVGYLVYVNNATSCFPPAEEPPIRAKRAVKTASYYPPATGNATLYNGTADVAVAHIDYLVSSYGYKEVKGKLEFVVDFVEAEYINMRKSGAKKTAKTSYSHYEGEHSDDDEGEHSYHAEAPYYGHEDRYYEGAHRGHNGDYTSSRHPRNLVKKGNLKITLLEKQYY